MDKKEEKEMLKMENKIGALEKKIEDFKEENTELKKRLEESIDNESNMRMKLDNSLREKDGLGIQIINLKNTLDALSDICNEAFLSLQDQSNLIESHSRVSKSMFENFQNKIFAFNQKSKEA